MASESIDGATNNERLLAAARLDNEDMLLDVFEKGGFDINFQDGLGNTALHYAASNGSLDVLEHILSHEECDVDPINRLEKATPLHLAVQIEDPEVRKAVVESLLEAGADVTIKDKNGDTAADLLKPEDTEIRALFRKAQAQKSVSRDDIASDDEGEEGSGSGSGTDEE
ncbi:ankyrin [Gloeophyllum trabeum ATCC 11539]|uniref:Ankyrin n=1 Tax=Gloeophyllum trabeum (strain ATCC 11539 / FP-39264 / Madison 617) TaxID=670483 RepID=S7QL96_GLOTA|nr:ankyrin [Gloeophyllum trabeum ATCC 11539]EPQ60072.1 ankyrin [Gloeophyllum trabeum ATCC 11539]